MSRFKRESESNSVVVTTTSERRSGLWKWLPVVHRTRRDYDAETLARLHSADTCAHCGGIHAISCPRVRSLQFRADGGIDRVEFWERWDASRVVYPEDLPPLPPEDSDEG